MKGSKLNNLLLVTILIGQLSYGSPTDAFADNVGIESNSLNKKDIANMSIQTNADQVKQGDRLDLTFRIVNSSEQLIPMGKSFIIHVDSKGIDYGTIDLSDTILNRYFNSTVNAADGTITLILKKDIIGDGSHINAKIGSTVTGEIGNSYKITANDNNGNTIPVDHDTFSPGDNLSVYGTINSYWGHSDIDNGNFTGKDSIIEAGVFSRSTNRIDIFGEFNTNYQNWGDLVDNTKGKYVNMVFSYDSNQKLDISSIKLYKRSDHSNVDFTTIDDGSSVKPIVIIDELNHTFIVKLRFNSVMGGPSSKEVLGVDYSTYVKDATISYQNNMKLLDQDGNVLPPEFNLYSIFTEEGSSLVFPTVLSENQRFPLGELNSTNAEQILKEKTSAKDTDDGDISLENITVDTSKINFDRPGIYKVTYKAINSAGMIAGKTYDVEIYDNAIAALPLIVHYVDETGKEIHEAQKISGNIGDKYDATTDEYKLKIEGYSLDEDKLPINSVGTLSDTDQTVTYVYKQDPIKANDVTVHYVDETGKEIHEVEKISGNIGDKYDATTDEYKLKIEGYSLDEDKLPINSVGTLSDTDQTVTYVYKQDPIKANDVTVHYVDETGKEIHEVEKISGNIGDKYDATTDEYKLKIEGYSLDEDKLPINSVGTLSDTDQTVTYVYKQDPIKANDVTVHYVDETGKEIHEVQQINGINISKNEESKDLSRTLPKTREDIKFNKKISILGLLVLCCTYIGLFKKRKGV